MKSLTSARGFTARAIAVSWRLFESGAVSQSTHLLTHTQVIADLIFPVYAQAGDWSKGGPPVPWQVGQWCLGLRGGAVEPEPFMKGVYQVVGQAELLCGDFEKNSRWPLKVSAQLLSKTLHNLGGLGLGGDAFEVLDIPWCRFAVLHSQFLPSAERQYSAKVMLFTSTPNSRAAFS